MNLAMKTLTTGMNIRETYTDENGSVIGYDYLAYDSGKPTELQLRIVNDNWKIINQFDLPSWTS